MKRRPAASLPQGAAKARSSAAPVSDQVSGVRTPGKTSPALPRDQRSPGCGWRPSQPHWSGPSGCISPQGQRSVDRADVVYPQRAAAVNPPAQLRRLAELRFGLNHAVADFTEQRPGQPLPFPQHAAPPDQRRHPAIRFNPRQRRRLAHGSSDQACPEVIMPPAYASQPTPAQHRQLETRPPPAPPRSQPPHPHPLSVTPARARSVIPALAAGISPRCAPSSLAAAQTPPPPLPHPHPLSVIPAPPLRHTRASKIPSYPRLPRVSPRCAPSPLAAAQTPPRPSVTPAPSRHTRALSPSYPRLLSVTPARARSVIPALAAGIPPRCAPSPLAATQTPPRPLRHPRARNHGSVNTP